MMAEYTLKCGAVILVDAHIFKSLSHYTWRLDPRGYVTRTATINKRPKQSVYLHREVIGAIKGEVVDHINGNPLDNRIENLRIGTQAQNLMNGRKRTKGQTSSRYKGVCLLKARGKWRANISVNKKVIYLGEFDCEHEAGHAYNKAAIKYYGEFACLNPVGE